MVLGEDESHGTSRVIEVGPPAGLDTLIVPSNAASRRSPPACPVPAPGRRRRGRRRRRRRAAPPVGGVRERRPTRAPRRRACRRWPGTRRPRSRPPSPPAPAAGRSARRSPSTGMRHVEGERLDRTGQTSVGEHRRVDAAHHRPQVAQRRPGRGARLASICRAASGSCSHRSSARPRVMPRRPAGPGRRRAGRARSGAARPPSGRPSRARLGQHATRCSSGLGGAVGRAATGRGARPGRHDRRDAEPPERTRSRRRHEAAASTSSDEREADGGGDQQPGQVTPGHRVRGPAAQPADATGPRVGRYGDGHRRAQHPAGHVRCRSATERVTPGRSPGGAGAPPRAGDSAAATRGRTARRAAPPARTWPAA